MWRPSAPAHAVGSMRTCSPERRPAVTPRLRAVLVAAIFDAQLAADLAGLGPDSRVQAGRQWGEEVGAAVLEARADDGSSPNETQPAGSGVGVFRASWSGVQFRNLKPFAIKDAAVYVS